MSKKPDVIISYVPCLLGNPTQTVDIGKTFHLEQVQEMFQRGTDLSVAVGCAWGIDSGAPVPMLVLDHGDAIYEHLMIWSEGKPEEWFDLIIHFEQGVYAVVLMPNLERSTKRSERVHGKLPKKVQILFAPLHFVALPGSETGTTMKPMIRGKTKFGIIDRARLAEDMSNIGEVVRDVGTFRVINDNGIAHQNIMTRLED